MKGWGFLNAIDFKIDTKDSFPMPNMDFLDLPKECLEGDCLDEGDWDEKFKALGPIPSEAFMGPSEVFGDNTGNAALVPTVSGPSENSPGAFQSPSPDSVLERITSETPIGVHSRTKRQSSTTKPWRELLAPISSTSKRSREVSKRKPKKRKWLSELSNSSQRSSATKRCSHCAAKDTPQWREGPMGPKTLCNACGVRFRSGRLLPEYRPLASPTFVESMHSNSHKKVIQMRDKALQGPTIESMRSNSPRQVVETNKKALQGVVVDKEIDPPPSPPPEFVPLSGYLYDCVLGSSGQYPLNGSLFR
ncbi:hypothetical protein RHGRI_036520 [Rhododendron griersonianum]|uniref:GATA-type domain-containing protein n=1 Tax=Rhododendron griersonianum TaxID=479676 RepID=A0AAV6HP35_9ERIC|nr:hypothetical protein RHGRI_036520 [Rhododendron griersonianum]